MFNKVKIHMSKLIRIVFFVVLCFFINASAADKIGYFDEETFYVDFEQYNPTQIEQQNGYVLFKRNYLEMVFPATNPRAGKRFEKLSIFGAPGEFEPLTFCVKPLLDLRKVRVGITDLKNESGSIIPRSNLDVRQVRYEKRSYSFDRGSPMLSPVILEKVYPDINNYKVGETHRIWITVHIPENCPPGIYKGVMNFCPGNAPVSKIPVEINVLPIQLQEPPVMFAITAYEHYTVEDFRKIYRDMRDHGMNSVKFEQMLGNRMYMENGRVKVDFDGNGYLEKALDAYSDMGFTWPFLWAMSGEPLFHYDPFSEGEILYYGDIADWCLSFGEPESEAFAFAYRGVVQAVLDEAEKRGWPEIIFQPFNEPISHPDPLQDRLLFECLKILKNMGVKTELNGLMWPSEYDRILPYLDNASFHDGPYAVRKVYDPVAWNKLVHVADSLKMGIMFYNADNTGIHPEAMRFAYGMGLWCTRPAGIGALQWTYRRQDPVKENALGYPYLRYEGTQAFSYPESDVGSGGPTTGWEGIREGVDDYKYYYTFMQTVKRATDSGNEKLIKQAEKATKELESMWEKISYENVHDWRTRQQKWLANIQKTGEGRAEITGTLKVDNGWNSFDDYDNCRKLAAEWIVKLQSQFE